MELIPRCLLFGILGASKLILRDLKGTYSHWLLALVWMVSLLRLLSRIGFGLVGLEAGFVNNLIDG